MPTGAAGRLDHPQDVQASGSSETQAVSDSTGSKREHVKTVVITYPMNVYIYIYIYMQCTYGTNVADVYVCIICIFVCIYIYMY